jgi:protein-disulfide isomerase
MKILLAFAALLPCLAAGPDVDKGRSMGDPSAPLMFEIYSDFSCPGCKHLHENVLPSLIADYVRTGKAAALAVAAARVGKYQTVSDALFRSQQAWGVNGRVWETVGNVLTPEEQKQVQALAADPAVLAAVQRDVDRGTQIPIGQTPTLMVTYRLRQQPWTQFADYNLFRGYIDALLKK